MTKNIYTAPSSNLKVANNFRGSPSKAIFFGLLIYIVGSVIGAIFVGIAFGIYWVSMGVSAEEIETFSQTNTFILVAYLIEAGLFSIWSGYYVAKKTNYSEYKHCVIMILIGTLIGVVLLAAMPEMYSNQPLWYTLTSFFYYPIVVIYGCRLWVKSKT